MAAEAVISFSDLPLKVVAVVGFVAVGVSFLLAFALKLNRIEASLSR